MSEPDLDKTLLGDFLSATGALVTRQLNKLPEDTRLQIADAVNNGVAKLELRVQIADGETEIVLVPIAGGDATWLLRTSPSMH